MAVSGFALRWHLSATEAGVALRVRQPNVWCNRQIAKQCRVFVCCWSLLADRQELGG